MEQTKTDLNFLQVLVELAEELRSFKKKKIPLNLKT